MKPRYLSYMEKMRGDPGLLAALSKTSKCQADDTASKMVSTNEIDGFVVGIVFYMQN